jgi:hypothetical protein
MGQQIPVIDKCSNRPHHLPSPVNILLMLVAECRLRIPGMLAGFDLPFQGIAFGAASEVDKRRQPVERKRR